MIPLRLDDLGACSKQYERWSRHRWANIWPLHDRRLFGAWGPYRELHPWELEDILRLVDACGASITFAITACWVEPDGSLTPYHDKFPAAAAIIKTWTRRAVVEVAAHGFTHCDRDRYPPRWIGGNRQHHREHGIAWQDAARLSLERWIDQPITTFIAPGQRAAGDPCRVYHDRDFVLDHRTLGRFREDLLCHEYRSMHSWTTSLTAGPTPGGSSSLSASDPSGKAPTTSWAPPTV